MLAVYAIPLLILVLFVLVMLNSLFPSLGLDRRPIRLMRPTLLNVMAWIALCAIGCFLDVPIIREQHHWSGSAVLIGCEFGFLSTAVGLRLMRRQSLLALVSSCFVLAVGFTVVYAFLAIFVFYTWGVYH